MKKIVLAYGLLGGILIAVLKVIEYRFLVVEHSIELYGGIVAIFFSLLGIWLGLKLTRTRRNSGRERGAGTLRGAGSVEDPFVTNVARQEQLGITPRELEILELMAAGLSNREIADRLYVSENTVKTHSAHVFGKLNARRRTKAVELAKEAGLIP